jgi:predicted regulator of amino acid metabolism with ACT domain
LAKIVATVATQVARHAFRISVRLVITKERVAEPFGGVTIVAMGAIDADVIETVQANERA